ncbi:MULTISPECIES: hypothetical protein [Cupriavidus]|nr:MULTISPECIES: hypothetical protein [Cupriavidus]MEC3764291.1 hypothetical protein [Cupriavidus sp. SS-3]
MARNNSRVALRVGFSHTSVTALPNGNTLGNTEAGSAARSARWFAIR